MLPILVGLGSIAGLFCLWLFRNGDRCVDHKLCHVHHKMGPITLRHYEVIDCERAIEVAEMAQWVWWQLVVPEFHDQVKKLNPTKGFDLFVVFDVEGDYGGQNLNKITVNQVKRPVEETLREKSFLSTLAEELHHLAEWRVYGAEPFIYYQDIVRYYALNGREYRGLRFAVAHVEWRVELFEKVEKYRALHGIK